MADQSKPSYAFGRFLLDPTKRVLVREGQVVPLTPKVFDTLLLLVENSERVMEKEEMIEYLWPNSFVEERNLAQNIFTLRKALGEESADKYIETVPRRGYRFVAAVRRLPDEGDDLILARRVRSHVIIEEEIPDRLPSPTGGKALPSARHARRLRIVLICCAIAALAVAGLYVWFSGGPRAPETVANVRSIAVLPFKLIASDENDPYTGLGMADALITRLSSIHQLIVRPTRAVLKYDSLEQDPLTAGRELKVDSLLDGKVQRSGGRIRVTVQLLRVSDGAPLWAETFDERFTDIFAVQDSISDRVTQAMVLKLSGEEKQQLAKRYTRNTEAYEEYVKGRYFWNKRTEEGLRAARDHFDEAIGKDPAYAMAYVGLAESYVLFSTYGIMPARQAFPKAEAAAKKALDIDEQLAEAHASLGVVEYEYNWNWAGADREFKRALELRPSYATAHQWYGGYLISQGRFEEGIQQIERARELDPNSPIINASVGWFHYFAREYDKAIEEGRRAINLDSSTGIAHFFLGEAYLMKGMHDEAIAELRRALAGAPNDPESLAALAQASYLAGRRDEAMKVVQELLDQARRAYVPPFYIAVAYAGVDNKDEAFRWFDKAYQERAPDLVGLGTEPRFDQIRPDPRFADLLKRIGF
jgi:DNA-binding winged helix-turn-helix (wHTH) protein/TolB-like protein